MKRLLLLLALPLAAHAQTATINGLPNPVAVPGLTSTQGNINGLPNPVPITTQNGTTAVINGLTVTFTSSGGGSTPTITTTSPLPAGTVGTAYTDTLTATGGTTPYTWSISTGTLPTGLSLSGAVISGTPSAAGTNSFTIMVTDAASHTATLPANLTINGSLSPNATTVTLGTFTPNKTIPAQILAQGFSTNRTTTVTNSHTNWASTNLINIFKSFGTPNYIRVGGSDVEAVIWDCQTLPSVGASTNCTGPVHGAAGSNNFGVQPMPTIVEATASTPNVNTNNEYTMTTGDVDNFAAFLFASGWNATWGVGTCLNWGNPAIAGGGQNQTNACNLNTPTKDPNGWTQVQGGAPTTTPSDQTIRNFAAVAANEAQYVANKFGSHLLAFEIGNEPPESWKLVPNAYTFWEQHVYPIFTAAILAKVPGAKFQEPADEGYSLQNPRNAYVQAGTRGGTYNNQCTGCVNNSFTMTSSTLSGSYHVYGSTQAGNEADYSALSNLITPNSFVLNTDYSTNLPKMAAWAGPTGASIPWYAGEAGPFSGAGPVGREHGTNLWLMNNWFNQLMWGSSGYVLYAESSPMNVDDSSGNVTGINANMYAYQLMAMIANGTNTLMTSTVAGTPSSTANAFTLPGFGSSHACQAAKYQTGQSGSPYVSQNPSASNTGSQDNYAPTNFCGYGVAGSGQHFAVLVNSGYTDLPTTVYFPSTLTSSQYMLLQANLDNSGGSGSPSYCPNNQGDGTPTYHQLCNSSDVTLGGATFTTSAGWTPSAPVYTTSPFASNYTNVTVPAFSIALVRVTP